MYVFDILHCSNQILFCYYSCVTILHMLILRVQCFYNVCGRLVSLFKYVSAPTNRNFITSTAFVKFAYMVRLVMR